MTAGSGIFHEEMLHAGVDGHEAIQLWFNLPESKKFVEPAYKAAQPEAVPEVETELGVTVRVVSGRYDEVEGAFHGIAVNPTVLDVRAPAGSSFKVQTAKYETSFAYFVEGAGDIPRLEIFRSGDVIEFTNFDFRTRFLFVSAKPLNEPVLQYRSLVMNTVDQMADAIEDLANGTFERK